MTTHFETESEMAEIAADMNSYNRIIEFTISGSTARAGRAFLQA
jgi:hypothetical protein